MFRVARRDIPLPDRSNLTQATQPVHVFLTCDHFPWPETSGRSMTPFRIARCSIAEMQRGAYRDYCASETNARHVTRSRLVNQFSRNAH